MNDAELRELAETIVGRLFTNGGRQRATRLVLVDESRSGPAREIRTAHGMRVPDLGGWSKGAARDHVYQLLKDALGGDDA